MFVAGSFIVGRSNIRSKICVLLPDLQGDRSVSISTRYTDLLPVVNDFNDIGRAVFRSLKQPKGAYSSKIGVCLQ